MPLPPVVLPIVWFVANGAAAFLTSVVARSRGLDRAIDVGNRTEKAAWNIVGAFLSLLAVTLLVRASLLMAQTGNASGFDLFAVLPPVTFGAYAVALRVSAEAGLVDELKPYAWLSLVFLALTALLTVTPWQYVVSAIGILCVSVPPGYTLLRIERRTHHG